MQRFSSCVFFFPIFIAAWASTVFVECIIKVGNNCRSTSRTFWKLRVCNLNWSSTTIKKYLKDWSYLTGWRSGNILTSVIYPSRSKDEAICYSWTLASKEGNTGFFLWLYSVVLTVLGCFLWGFCLFLNFLNQTQYCYKALSTNAFVNRNSQCGSAISQLFSFKKKNTTNF